MAVVSAVRVGALADKSGFCKSVGIGMARDNVFVVFVAGALGAAFATGLLLVWAVNNPTQAQKLIGQSMDNNRVTSNRGALLPIVPESVENGESPVVRVVKSASPAVVSIVVTQEVPVFENFFNPFNLRQPQQNNRSETERREVGGGSGFLVSADGLIVTNKHVVEGDNVEYAVFTSEGERFEAKVIARDPVNDIGVIKIEGSNLPFLEFGSSDNLEAGQAVIAIGNALGEFSNSVSVGVISGLSRSIQAGDSFGGRVEQLDNVIQTDAAINPGNSGGPLLDVHGRVIGVNVATALGSENIGFALPGDLVKSVVDSVKTTGKISRPMIGVRYVMLTPEIQEQNQLPVDQGALIIGGNQTTELAVIPGSPADKAGLEQGDIILEIDGEALTEENTLSSVIRKKKVGDTVSLTILHDGQRVNRQVALDEVIE